MENVPREVENNDYADFGRGGGGGVKGVYYGICTSSESVKGTRSSWL